MQVDMHYYGTYAMARAAGIKPESCQVIATAAQFVDDNAHKDSVNIGDGALIEVEATAHHAVDINNILPDDQRNIWVPFHFLPGNEGNSYTERLICRKNSLIAQQMVSNNISLAEQPYALELMGITAHVYADTFSHYGFSGVSSRHNKVVNDSFDFSGNLDPDIADYINKKAKSFFSRFRKEGGLLTNIKSWLGESAALGHGAVATYPDRPYLKWSFEYEYPQKRRDQRDNPTTFMEGCEALHNMFKRFAEKRPDHAGDNGKDFAAIEERVRTIINTAAAKEGRIQAWQTAAKAGDLFTQAETIPDYDARGWHQQREHLADLQDSTQAIDTAIYRYYQAASRHRHYVLRNLLPEHGLIGR
ncbi:DUF6765 family protein [Kaarinaea lacus]